MSRHRGQSGDVDRPMVVALWLAVVLLAVLIYHLVAWEPPEPWPAPVPARTVPITTSTTRP